MFYYHYTQEKAYTHKVVAIGLLVLAALSIYTILGTAGVTNQSSHVMNQVVGYVTAVASVALYTSLFKTIARVLQTKFGRSDPRAHVPLWFRVQLARSWSSMGSS